MICEIDCLESERKESMSKNDISEVFVLSKKMREILDVRLEHWTDSDRLIAVREYERFFALAVNFKKTLDLPVSKEIDQIWHYCILSTQEYFDTCRRFGTDYLHHEPRIGSSVTLPPEQKAKHDLEWILSYVQNFGKFDAEAIRCWPVINRMCSKSGWTLADFNAKIEMLLKGSQAI